MTGAPLILKCPECEESVRPCQVLLTEKHTLGITAYCNKCDHMVTFDFAFKWLFKQMHELFPPDPKITEQDLKELHQMGICFLKGDSL